MNEGVPAADGGSGQVIVVAGTWPPMACGIAPYSRNLAVGLQSRGLRVEVITDAAAQEYDPILLKRVARWSLTDVVRVVKLVRSRPGSIVHLQHPTRATRLKPAVYLFPLLLRLFARRHRIVTTFHYLRPVDRRTSVFRAFFLLPAAFSHAILVTTHWEAEYARRLFPRKLVVVAPAGPTETVLPPVDRRETRRMLGYSEDDFVVAFFGFLLPNKGIEPLMTALTMLPQHIKLMVIGAGYGHTNDFADALLERARAAGLSDRIRWQGRVESADLGPMLGAADCAALPFDEGASLKRSTLITAMQAGLPVITTLGPELDPLMQHGINLLLVPPLDAGGLAAAITRLEKDIELRADLVREATTILNAVGWDTIVDAHIQLYRTVRGCGPRTTP